jgi:hypothetical protein
MSNVLKVSLQTTIYSLADRGWSQRRIARELWVNRETVGRYLRLAGIAKPAISTPGSDGNGESKPAILTPGVEGSSEAKPAISTARLIGEQPEQSAFDFAESHPLIRDLKTYSDFINQYYHQHQSDDQHPQTTP